MAFFVSSLLRPIRKGTGNHKQPLAALEWSLAPFVLANSEYCLYEVSHRKRPTTRL